MSIDATSSAYASTVQLDGSERIPKQNLGQEDYLKLLAVQYATQDPLSPMDDTTFIAEMANFTALETNAQLASNFQEFADQSAVTSAQALLGRTVTVENPDLDPITGIVSAVRKTSDGPLVTVNGAEFSVTDVRRVALTTETTSENSTQP